MKSMIAIAATAAVAGIASADTLVVPVNVEWPTSQTGLITTVSFALPDVVSIDSISIDMAHTWGADLIVAVTGEPVPGTSYSWHRKPDGGAVFAALDGGWVYVSNSEVGGNRGGRKPGGDPARPDGDAAILRLQHGRLLGSLAGNGRQPTTSNDNHQRPGRPATLNQQLTRQPTSQPSQDMARQGKARQGNAMHGKARHGTAMQARPGQARPG